MAEIRNTGGDLVRLEIERSEVEWYKRRFAEEYQGIEIQRFRAELDVLQLSARESQSSLVRFEFTAAGSDQDLLRWGFVTSDQLARLPASGRKEFSAEQCEVHRTRSGYRVRMWGGERGKSDDRSAAWKLLLGASFRYVWSPKRAAK